MNYTKEEWNQYLFEIYIDYRNRNNWDLISGAHDDEDKAYFQMLDQMGLGSRD